MAESLDQLRQTLNKQRYSLTLPRQLVFRALQATGPMTMNQLIRACPSVDRVSIYRAVNLFESIGVTKRLQIGWKYQVELTDTFHDHHHHLACLRCGTIIHFDEDKQLESRLKSIAADNNFLVQDHQLEVQGLCQNCH